MVDEKIEEKQSIVDEETKAVYSDFGDDTTASSDDSSTTTTRTTVDPNKDIIKQHILTDTVTLGTSVAINVLPMVFKFIKAKNNNEVVKIDKTSLIKTVVSNVIPALTVLDDVAFKGKIQSKVPLKDARNIVNLVQLYPSAHKCANNFITNIVNKNNGKQEIALSKDTSNDMYKSLVNLFAPYFVSKFTNRDLSFSEKLNSAIPIGIFGKAVRYLCRGNPKLQRVYDTASNVVGLASSGTKLLGSSVRATPGSTVNKATNTISGVLNVVSDAMGMNRGSIGAGYDSWGGRSYGRSNFGYRNDFGF